MGLIPKPHQHDLACAACHSPRHCSCECGLRMHRADRGDWAAIFVAFVIAVLVCGAILLSASGR